MYLTKEFHRGRRLEFARRMKPHSIAIIPSAEEKFRNGDQDFQFRQDSNFYYLTGFLEPNSVLIIVAGETPKSVLFCQDIKSEKVVWEGDVVLGPQRAKEKYDFDEVYSIDALSKKLKPFIKKARYIYCHFQPYTYWDNRIIELIKKSRRDTHKALSKIGAAQDPSVILNEMRVEKTSEEIVVLRKASKISAKAHRRAMLACMPDILEYELEAELIREFIRHGSSRIPAYTSIVAGGENACTLHYNQNNAPLHDGDLVLIDAGCEYGLYASDITRTFPVNGKFTQEQKAIYEIVLNAQTEAIKYAKPNYYLNDLETIATNIIVYGLLKLGILKDRVRLMLKNESYKKFYPHSVGHWVGLDVHDTSLDRKKESTRKFKPGMIVTVEPGIYIPNNTKDVDKKWWGIGVRIEDTILITDGSPEILSKDVPKTISEIEALMKNRPKMVDFI